MNILNTKRITHAIFQPRSGRIGCIGWTGHNNLGDEAVFDAMQLILPNYSVTPFDASKFNKGINFIGRGQYG